MGAGFKQSKVFWRLPFGIASDRPVVGKNLLDLQTKQARRLEGEWQTRVIAFGFDGIHGLPRDPQLLRQLGLRPFPRCPELTQTVFHL